MKNYFVGFSIAAIGALAVFFFYIVPEQKRVREQIDNAYQKGLVDCSRETDTIFVKANPQIIYRDSLIYVEKPTSIKKIDNIIETATSIDTSIVYNDETFDIEATVSTKFNLKDLEGNNLFNATSKWFMDIRYKGLECIPDTMIVKIPKYITVVDKETNWFYVLIAFLTGNLIMLLSFIL